MPPGPPHILDDSLEVIAVLYRPVYLACVAGGSPKPYVSWKKNDEDLKDDAHNISVITLKKIFYCHFSFVNNKDVCKNGVGMVTYIVRFENLVALSQMQLRPTMS